MSAKSNSTTDARQELAELVKRKAEIAVSALIKGVDGVVLAGFSFFVVIGCGCFVSLPPGG